MGTGAGVEAAGAAVGAVVGTGFAVAAGVPVLPVLVVLAATVVPDPAVVAGFGVAVALGFAVAVALGFAVAAAFGVAVVSGSFVATGLGVGVAVSVTTGFPVSVGNKVSTAACVSAVIS